MREIIMTGGSAMLRAVCLCAASSFVLGSVALLPPATANAQTKIENLTPVTDAMLANPNQNDWLMWRRTSNSWGYSPLEQVNRRNVAQLKLVWTRPITQGDQEGTP